MVPAPAAPKFNPPRVSTPPAEPPAPIPPPSAAATRITPEVLSELESDPLIRAVITELGGRIVKVD